MGFVGGSAAVAPLQSALDQLAMRDVHAFGEQETLNLLAELLTARNRLDAVVLGVLRRIDADKLAKLDGCQTAASWLRGHGRLDPPHASALVHTARRLPELPDTGKALAAGEISLDHAQAITGLLRDCSVDDVRCAEPALLGAARDYDPQTVRRGAARVRETIHANHPKDAERRFADRSLRTWTTFGGAVAFDGVLSDEGAAAFQAALAPHLVPAGPDDDRSPAQRAHDGLVDLCKRALSHGQLPDVGGDRPRIVVHVGYADLIAGAGVAATGRGRTLDLNAVRKLGCDAETTRIVFGPAGEILDLGRTTRTANPAQRRALQARDGGCVFGVCDRPAQFTEAHHLTWWRNGGTTDLDNLALVCAFHHHLIHEENWTLQRDPTTGHWTTTAPDGRVIHRPPPHQRK